ncbi:hypothetical protein GCM10007898_16510 [Dyella flagellata]|uniref:Sulfotransferase family protein n=1 Tax=Dyella flagellata TaxID=1867833 RepID=A0ABQ5XAY7_9GAMM|nr:hypothetical protein GCM10007898_16510 [Dyella flagellata]
MHRSGTSAITRGLKALGVDLGESLLQPGLSENPLGFWEDSDVVALNQELMETLGCDWNSVARIDERSISSVELARFEDRAVNLLQDKFKTRTVWAFKDPRTARLLWFWKRVIERAEILDVSYVLCLRNPLAVSESLHVRNGIDRAVSILLWAIYTVEALQQIQASSTVLVDYDQLIEDGREVLRQVAQKLRLELSGEIEESYFTEFLTSDLRHSRFRLEELRSSGLADPAIVRLYEQLLKATGSDVKLDGGELVGAMESAAGWLQEVAAIRSAIDRVNVAGRDQRLSTSAQAEFERTEMFRLECDRLRERNGLLEGRQHETENIRAQVEMFRLECDRLRERNGLLEGRQHEMEDFRAEVEKLQLECDGLRSRNDLLEGHLDEMERVRSQAEIFRLECDRLRERNGELDGRLGEMENFRSHAETSGLERDKLRSRNNELEARLAEERSNLRSCQSRMMVLNAAIERERDRNLRLQSRNSALQTRVVGLRAERQWIAANGETILEELAQIREELTLLDGRRIALALKRPWWKMFR